MTVPPDQSPQQPAQPPQGPPAPGWYHDPGGSPSRRWWDGTQWTAATRPLGDPSGDAPPGPADLGRSASRQDWRSLRGIGMASSILLALMAVLALATAVAFFGRNRVIDGAFDGSATLDDVAASDERVTVTLGLTMLVFLTSGIVWLVWFAFAARNAATLTNVRRGAVWGWFVPIVSLFRPKQVANDVHRAAGDAHPPAVTQLWWGTWLVGTLLFTAAFRITQAANRDADLEGLQNAARLYTASLAALAVSAVLAILVTQRLTNRLEERAA